MPKGNKPKLRARAKQDPNENHIQTIGAAWEFKDGEGLAVKLQFIPTNWDGSFILVPPRENED